MDDIVLLSASRENTINKVRLMKQFRNKYSMKMNESKTHFFFLCVVHGSSDDNDAGWLSDGAVHTVYVRTMFTADGSISSSVSAPQMLKCLM